MLVYVCVFVQRESSKHGILHNIPSNCGFFEEKSSPTIDAEFFKPSPAESSDMHLS